MIAIPSISWDIAYSPYGSAADQARRRPGRPSLEARRKRRRFALRRAARPAGVARPEFSEAEIKYALGMRAAPIVQPTYEQARNVGMEHGSSAMGLRNVWRW